MGNSFIAYKMSGFKSQLKILTVLQTSMQFVYGFPLEIPYKSERFI